MRWILVAVAIFLGLASADAQQLPYTLPDLTVVGRIGSGSSSGPAQAIPFATLFARFTALTANANTVYAGPTSGGGAPAAFRLLVGADLPAPQASALGGIESITSLAHNWIAYIDTSGVPHQSQPAFTDVSGAITSAQCLNGTTSAIGCVQPDGNTIGVSSGVISTTFIPTPGGRLTLATHTPVMISTQSAKSTLYYDAYVHGFVPVYNGTADVVLPIGSNEISDVIPTSSTGVANSSGVFDEWAVNVSGTLTLCHATNGSGGGWASDSGSNTARGTGYSVLDNHTRSYITNANALANCYNGATNEGSISANKATYLGTFYTSGAGQISWVLPTAATTPAAGMYGLWNMYNRVDVRGQVADTTSSWTYNSATIREIHGDTTATIQYVRGLADDTFAAFEQSGAIGASSAFGIAGVCYNVTNAFSGIAGLGPEGASTTGTALGTFTSQDVGFNTLAACEAANSTTSVTFIGSQNGGVGTGLTFNGRF